MGPLDPIDMVCNSLDVLFLTRRYLLDPFGGPLDVFAGIDAVRCHLDDCTLDHWTIQDRGSRDDRGHESLSDSFVSRELPLPSFEQRYQRSLESSKYSTAIMKGRPRSSTGRGEL